MQKQPAAVNAAIQTLTKLGGSHGVEAVNIAYAEAIAELMACRERDVWRAKVTEGQRDMALLGGY